MQHGARRDRPASNVNGVANHPRDRDPPAPSLGSHPLIARPIEHDLEPAFIHTYTVAMRVTNRERSWPAVVGL